MIVTGGDITKITPEVVDKVEDVEKLEGYTAFVELQTINSTIFLCNVRFEKPDTGQVAFTSLNLYDKGTRDLVFNMQDGKVSGFEIDTRWVDAYREFPECPEDLASEVLFDLFVQGWD